MDYSHFNYLVEKVMRDVSTRADEKELIHMLQGHVQEKEKERKSKAYIDACIEIHRAIDKYLKTSDEDVIEIKIETPNCKDYYFNVNSAYYDSKDNLLTFCLH